ncbi:MAG: hypothetical protein KDD99_18900, partial [Bacteroidetes bacterium]|nr:hypothetical protein [Bacteroidota bacterium]
SINSHTINTSTPRGWFQPGAFFLYALNTEILWICHNFQSNGELIGFASEKFGGMGNLVVVNAIS